MRVLTRLLSFPEPHSHQSAAAATLGLPILIRETQKVTATNAHVQIYTDVFRYLCERTNKRLYTYKQMHTHMHMGTHTHI